MSYVDAAKMLSCTAAELLWNGAEKARLVQSRFKPEMTRREYLASWCGICERIAGQIKASGAIM